MYSFFVENKKGEVLELTHNDNYAVVEIDGLAPGEAVINTSHDVGADGSVFNSSYHSDRTITLTLAINYPAEANRIDLYKYFQPKSSCRLRYKNSRRDVWIEAYVSRFNVSFFEKKQVAQIVMTCPKPYFNGQEKEAEMSKSHALFQFPFEAPTEFSTLERNIGVSMLNRGDVYTGAVFTIYAQTDINHIGISNEMTGQAFIVDTIVRAGESLVVNTNQKEKSVYINKSDGTVESVAGYFSGDWVTLQPGLNEITLTVAGSALAEVAIVEKYEGV